MERCVFGITNGSLKSEAFSGAKWTTASSLIVALTRFIQVAVLTRLLTPSDFGLVGMVTIVIGFAQVFSDAGVSAAIVQKQKITSEQLSSLYWLNIFSGIAVFLVMLAVTPIAVSFFGQEDLRSLFRLSAFLFLIIPFGQQFQFLLQKDLKFDTIAKTDVAATLTDAVVSIAIAFAGTGAASLIIGQLCNATVRSAILFIKGKKYHTPKFRFKTSDMHGFISFGLYQMGEKILNYFQSNVANLLIGKMLGPQQLGYYTIAYNLIIQPTTRINPIINRVIFPLFSKVQDDTERLKRGFFLAAKYLALINNPLLIGLAAVAKPFVVAVYGVRWIPCVPVIQILALVGIIKALGNPVGSLILSKGRADLGFKWNLLATVFISAATYFAAKGNIVTVAYALLVMNIIFFLLSYFLLVKPLVGKCAKELYYDNFLVPMSYSLAMGAVVFAIIKTIPLGNIQLLIIGITAGATSYAVLMSLFEKNTIADFRKHMAKR